MFLFFYLKNNSKDNNNVKHLMDRFFMKQFRLCRSIFYVFRIVLDCIPTLFLVFKKRHVHHFLPESPLFSLESWIALCHLNLKIKQKKGLSFTQFVYLHSSNYIKKRLYSCIEKAIGLVTIWRKKNKNKKTSYLVLCTGKKI